MGFTFENLDERTREFMLEEFDSDISDGTLYYSKDFSVPGRERYESIMREAIVRGDATSLSRALTPAMFNPTRVDKNGRVTRLNLQDAASKFAEGEFNRFYLRGLSRRAIADGREALEVYRAKTVDNPRPESEALRGRLLPSVALLEDLRENKGFGTYLGVPMGPNSGLSARLPRA